MKPLRPHNYYGGTTCPGRVTGQVSTIRSLIPEEDDMEPETGKVSSPSAASLKKLPSEFGGKWPVGASWSIGGFIRYGFFLLWRRDRANAALGARINVLEALKNPCNWGTDHGTMGERMTEYRNAIEALEQEVANLKTEMEAMRAASGIQEGESVAIVRRS